MLNKAEYTQKLLEQVPESARLEFDYAMQSWWYDIRPESGLRLTVAGFKAFKELGIVHYEFSVPAPVLAKPKQLITLNKKMTCPYYLTIGKDAKIILFGSKEATVYSLFGDINKFVNMLTRE